MNIHYRIVIIKILISIFVLFSDVFPYGIYMLAYDYISKALSSSEWALQRRKQLKELGKTRTHFNYIDISIPILSGAFAGWYIIIKNISEL